MTATDPAAPVPTPTSSEQGTPESERPSGAWAIVWTIVAAFVVFLGGTLLIYAWMVGWIDF